MPSTTQPATLLPSLVLRQALSLIAATRAVTRNRGLDDRAVYCLISARDTDALGWSWWIVGERGEARLVNADIVAAVDDRRDISAWGWWLHRLHVERSDARLGRARVLVGSFVNDAPFSDYPTGPDGRDLTWSVPLVAGEQPALIMWAARRGGVAGWPR